MTRSGLVTFHEDLEPLLVPIDTVTQHPDNPNNGDVEAIAQSVEINGYIEPIVVQRSTGYIIAGNHRYQALLGLRSTVIPAVFVDLDDIAAKRYLLASNRIAALAEIDNGNLLPLLSELDDANALLGSGYNRLDLEQLQILEDLTPDYTDHASWPTLTLVVPPHLKNVFYEFTEHAVSDHDRLEMLLRQAGWQEET